MEKVVKLNRGYEDLQVWQKSIDFAEKIYTVTSGFPRKEIYGLTSQLRRAAVSIASNIAEGSARNNTKEFRQFLGIALGSTAELKTQLYIAVRVQHIDPTVFDELFKQASEVERMLNGLLKSLN